MQINIDILLTYGATTKRCLKGETIFTEGSNPVYYYQIIEGEVKVCSYNNDGKEFIQGIFRKGQSFGEPPLFIDKPYPSNAILLTDSIIIRLEKYTFMGLLDEYPDIGRSLLKTFSCRLYNKAVSAQILITSSPEERIVMFLDEFKKQYNLRSKQKIPYTRQQIADLVGLRVETVIRALMRLKDSGKVEIINHRLFY